MGVCLYGQPENDVHPPEALAGQLLKRVARWDRSRYVTDAIAAKLHEREERLIRACEIANGDPDVLALEREWDALADKTDEITEPWNDTQTR